MKLRAVEPAVALDEWEPFPDGSDSAQAPRSARRWAQARMHEDDRKKIEAELTVLRDDELAKPEPTPPPAPQDPNAPDPSAGPNADPNATTDPQQQRQAA